MHVIPQSWSHLHILVSVFPPFGLLFTLGFYLAGLRTKNDNVRRTCLVVFALLALLSVPIYISGTGSMAALSGNARVPKDLMNTHYVWGIAALVVLVISGVVAVVELWRAQSAGRPSADPSHLVLALAIVALGLTAVASEFGWELNIGALQLGTPIDGVSTSPAWLNAHLILNHVPTAGFVFAIFFYLVALVLNNDLMKQGSLTLFVICSIIGVPTYVAGTAAMWALTQPAVAGISKAAINAHRDMALWTMFGLAFTGGAAWIELWRYRYFQRFSTVSLALVLLFAVVTLGIMTETGHRGGLINHPEIRTAADVLPTDPNAGVSPAIEKMMNEKIWFVPWQIVHFFGYSFIFGAVFAVALRVLGWWKSMSFASMHRLLLLGFLGVIMNIVSGMMMMLADAYHYVVDDSLFAPKIALIAVGAIAVLYFSESDRLWNVKAGEDAPAGAKLVAAIVLLAWAGVIVCGRMLFSV